MKTLIRSAFATSLLALSAFPVQAFSIGTWNVATGTVENVTYRSDSLKDLGQAIRKSFKTLPDVLVLQEVTSYAASMKIAELLGYREATVVTSDFGKDQEIWPFALEIGIITTRKVRSAGVFQSNKVVGGEPRAIRAPFIQLQSSGKLSQGGTSEIKIPTIEGIEKQSISRGILRVELTDGTVIYGVHLKSSGLESCRWFGAVKDSRRLQNLATGLGLAEHAEAIRKVQDAVSRFVEEIPDTGVPATIEETLASARNREAAVAAIAELAKKDVANGKSVFVAGDFNTPVYEKCKTGIDLKEDSRPAIGCRKGTIADTCGATDGFDDTIALLAKGLSGGPRFRVLTGELDNTYVKSGFVKSPIDNILVAGPAAEATYRTRKILGETVKNAVFGSDHYAVVATAQQ